MARRLIAFVVMSFWLVAMVSVARADTGDIIEPQNETSTQGFQAGTCTQEAEVGTPPKNCSPETPDIFFKRAAGHPPIGFTQYFIQNEGFEELSTPPFPPGSLKAEITPPFIDRTIKTLRVDLPPGLTVNPEATPSRCTLAQFLNKVGDNFVPACANETKVGEELVTLVTNKPNVEVPGVGVIPIAGFVIPPTAGATKVPIYNIEPAPGEPAKFGFVINAAVPVFLETEVAWENDFHESFRIKLANTAEVSGLSTLISRLVNFGDTTGDGTYITNPTTCFDPNEPDFERLYSTWFRAESYGDPNPTFPQGSTPVEAKPPKDESGQHVMQEECETVPFEPSIETTTTTDAIDSPTGGTVETKLPFEPASEGGANQSQSHVRSAEISLPAGMGLNPSGASGLQACTDAQFKKGVRVYENECPAESRIGTATIDSPPLAEPLEGGVYVGQQLSSDPASGQMFRIMVEAKSEHEGIAARLVGNIVANPSTGQLTAVLDEQQSGEFSGLLPRGLPQVPFESVRIELDAAKEVLTTPPTCATAESTGQLEPWVRPGEQAPVSSSFTLSADPGGGTCPTTLGARRFTPGYSATTDNSVAGAYTPFRVHIGRGDGEQEVKGVDVTLPEGLIGNLSGLLYCPEANLEVAAQKTGYQESVGPSCPDVSRIGAARTRAGSGPDPLAIDGNAYLAGPYKGAPLSMVVITPARSGPFDLGNVIVRVALFVDPETTEVNAVSDPIPDVFGGVRLDLRAIDVDVDRAQFIRNGTSCSQDLATRGSIKGGGSNPTDPAAFSSYDVSSFYRPAQCGRLQFRPKLFTRLFGGRNVTQRAKHPSLRAVLDAREGDANIARAALVMPRALFLDQGNIRTVCTRVQLAADECPQASIYGRAQATSPLIDGNLKGPVYLVSSNNELPDLLADLRGQVNVRLRGVISSQRGGLKTVFRTTPDVPVNRFVLRMQGGRQKGLLINSRNLCKGRLLAFLNITAQNSRRVRTTQQPIRVGGC